MPGDPKRASPVAFTKKCLFVDRFLKKIVLRFKVHQHCTIDVKPDRNQFNCHHAWAMGLHLSDSTCPIDDWRCYWHPGHIRQFFVSVLFWDACLCIVLFVRFFHSFIHSFIYFVRMTSFHCDSNSIKVGNQSLGHLVIKNEHEVNCWLAKRNQPISLLAVF